MTDEEATTIEVCLPGRLQDMVLESVGVDEFLTRLAQLAADNFTSRDNNVLCAVTLLRPQTKTTIASSSQDAAAMDHVQFRFDDGPCLRAAREGQMYVVSDFATDTRFGGYSSVLRKLRPPKEWRRRCPARCAWPCVWRT